jgi:hypothetical protein
MKKLNNYQKEKLVVHAFTLIFAGRLVLLGMIEIIVIFIPINTKKQNDPPH